MTSLFENDTTTHAQALEMLKRRRSLELNKPKRKSGMPAENCRDEALIAELHGKIAELKSEMNPRHAARDDRGKPASAKKDMKRYMEYKQKSYAKRNKILRFIPTWGKKKTEQQ